MKLITNGNDSDSATTIKQLTLEETEQFNKQGDKLFKAQERHHLKAIAAVSDFRASLWQQSYEIWGKTSLRFRYPLLHGPLTKEEKQERKHERIQYQRKQQNDRDRFSAQLENELYKTHYEKFRNGFYSTTNPIPYSLIEWFLAPDVNYHTMQAVKYLEEKLAAEMLASDIPFNMDIRPLTSAYPQH